MPCLVREGLTIQDVIAKRVRFKRVRVGQIFYAEKRWWTKSSLRTAIPADRAGSDWRRFRAVTLVRIFDESMPTLAPHPNPESFDDFIAKAAL